MKAKNQKLSEFIRKWLDMNVIKYAELENVPERTLRDRWHSEKGRKSIEDAVFRRYVIKFISETEGL